MNKRFSFKQFHMKRYRSAKKDKSVFKIGVCVLLLAALPFLQSCDGGNGDPADDASDEGWEVWLADQSDSADISADNPTGTYGSRIIIYESSDILAAPSGWYAEDDPDYGPTVIEAADVFPNAFEELGVDVRRLHGMLPDHQTHRYMNANFFGPGAGMVGIIDAEGQCTQSDGADRECGRIQGDPDEAAKLAKALFRTTGPEGSAPSNHMSYFSPDGTKLIVSNLGAKLLERIDYDAETDTFHLQQGGHPRSGGRTRPDLHGKPMADSTLPDGQVSGEYHNFQDDRTRQAAPSRKGRGGPITSWSAAGPSSNNQHAYLTLGGGGLFVVDITTEPMTIVAEYTNDVVSGAGCGGEEGGDYMHINAGVSASPAGADDSVFVLYAFPLDYPAGANPHTAPNVPRPVKYFEHKRLGIPETDEEGLASRRDAHGSIVSHDDRYLYQVDRIQNVIEVFDIDKIINDPDATLEEQAVAHVSTIDLTGSGLCVGDGPPFVNQEGEDYEFGDDPAGDSQVLSPDGSMIISPCEGRIRSASGTRHRAAAPASGW